MARCSNRIVRAAKLVGVSFLNLGALSRVGRTYGMVGRAANSIMSLSAVPVSSRLACRLCRHNRAVKAFRFRSPNVRGCLHRLGPAIFRSLVTVGTLCHPKPVSCVPSFVTHGGKRRTVACSVPYVRGCLGSACNVAICRRRIVLLSHRLTDFAQNRSSTLHGTVNGGGGTVMSTVGPGFVGRKRRGNRSPTILRGV